MSEDGVMSGNYRGIEAGRGYLDKQTNTGFNVTAWMSESDARLISCAPEMYEALKAIKNTLEIALDEGSAGYIGHNLIVRDRLKGLLTYTAILARIEGGE
jgi:hypothetical protein